MLSGFFAYTSRPEVRETISNAVKSINANGQYSISTWEETKSAGTYLIHEICNQIDDSDLFLADLTYINHNVLFELGYAIAKNKRIVLFLDPTVKNAIQNYGRLNLSLIRYLEFRNSKELTSRFLKENISDTLSGTFLNQMFPGYPNPPIKFQGMLYLKSRHEDNASIRVSRLIDKLKFTPTHIDDPNEAMTQSVEWYLRCSLEAAVIIGHFVDDERELSEFHNAKVAFCAGMGYAFKKNVLLLVKEPFKHSLDYLHLLITYSTSTECEKLTTKWLDNIELSEKDKDSFPSNYPITDKNSLPNADLGSFIAEQEVETLPLYYVPIINMNDLLRSDYSLLIGRKGAGKSALLYIIKHNLSENKKNHICIIKPVGYELEGLLKVLRDLPEESEKSYLMESLWKFLIYTELAKSITNKIADRPPYTDNTPEELALIEFVDANKNVVTPDFWERFETIIETCKNLKDSSTDRRLKISEYLHDNLISRLKSLLLGVFPKTYERVVVLVDNLDKSWKIGNQIELLSSFLFGLISVSSRIRAELSPKNCPFEFTILTFLRSDIFTHIHRIAHERDKLKYLLISWDDPEILLKVIEDRLVHNFPEYSSEEIWEHYFCPEVNGIPTKKFIVETIVPRPRDIVFLVLEALRFTIAKQHKRIEEDDLLSAQQRYSQHALDSLIVEGDIDSSDMENLIYEFVGQKKILTKEELITIITTSMKGNYNPDDIIEMLCDRAFLGRQVKPNEFRYQNSFEDAIPKSLQKNYKRISGREAYEISAPYRKYLEISE